MVLVTVTMALVVGARWVEYFRNRFLLGISYTDWGVAEIITLYNSGKQK